MTDMTHKIFLFIGLFTFFQSDAFTQNKSRTSYTLNDCIELAISNNLDLKSATLKTKTADINYHQVRLDMIPSFNANVDIGVNNGRSISPLYK